MANAYNNLLSVAASSGYHMKDHADKQVGDLPEDDGVSIGDIFDSESEGNLIDLFGADY
jgi:hypothetical protein